MRVLLAAAAPIAALTLAAPAFAQDHSAHDAAEHARHGALEAAAANANRDADRARDEFRNPVGTLAFFQLEPDMKVGEYAPGGGWYSRMLGNYLGDEGKLVGLWRSTDVGQLDEEDRTGLRDGAAAFPAKVEEWTGRPPAQTAGFTLDAVPDAEKGTFDRVLVIRMLHNMMRSNIADSELERMRALLKPGGMLGIVQHRAKADAPANYADGSNGYLRQGDVVGFVEALGFELVEASEINANPRDPANWEGGVWMMPPTLGGDEAMDARTRDLGESDRMTLLFRKR
jgi:predicted methyltransferase